jgi:hypothetical protein
LTSFVKIIACIERAVCSQEINPDLLLANARKLRAKTASHPVTARGFVQAKAAGRV